MHGGLVAQHVPDATATRLAGLPPVGSLFAAFLGYNPVGSLLGPQLLGSLPPSSAATLTGPEFFPHLVSAPFHSGLVIVFGVAIAMSLVGALTSLMRGTRFVHDGVSDHATPVTNVA
jgi:hypothetical protein